MTDFKMTVTPQKASLASRPAKGMGRFSVRVVDGNNDDEVTCVVELPKALAKTENPTAADRDELISWLAYRLLDQESLAVRKMVEHAWECTFLNVVTEELLYGGMDVEVRQSTRNNNSWSFAWDNSWAKDFKDGRDMSTWASSARAKHLESVLPKAFVRKGSPGRF